MNCTCGSGLGYCPSHGVQQAVSDTPRADAHIRDLYRNPEVSGRGRTIELLKQLERELTAARQEIERLKTEFADVESGKTTLIDMAISNGSLTASVGSEMCGVMAAQFAELLKEKGGPNYLEMQFTDRREPRMRMVLTLRWEDGKTPHELRAEAEQERDTLRAENAELKNRLQEVQDSGQEYIAYTDLFLSCGSNDDPTSGKCGTCRACLLEQNAELRKDKERLDWCDRNPLPDFSQVGNDSGWGIRHAIDAAREKGQG